MGFCRLLDKLKNEKTELFAVKYIVYLADDAFLKLFCYKMINAVEKCAKTAHPVWMCRKKFIN